MTALNSSLASTASVVATLVVPNQMDALLTASASLPVADLFADGSQAAYGVGANFSTQFGLASVVVAPITVFARSLYAPQIQQSWPMAVPISPTLPRAYPQSIVPAFVAGLPTATSIASPQAVGALFGQSFGVPRAARSTAAAGANFAQAFGAPTVRMVLRPAAARFSPSFGLPTTGGGALGLATLNAQGAQFAQRFGLPAVRQISTLLPSGFSSTQFGLPVCSGPVLRARSFGVSVRFGRPRVGG
jgi:hypothetical protein